MFSKPQFILWKAEQSKTNPEKTDKFPIDYNTLQVADAHNPAIWLPFEEIRRRCPPGYGIGFVFTRNDQYFFIDIDNCALPDRSDWTPEAKRVLAMFPGAFVERSVSGTGLHIIGSTRYVPEHSCKSPELKCDLYTENRFVALTMDGAVGSPDCDHTSTIASICAEYFTPNEFDYSLSWTTTAVPEWEGHKDDAVLIAKAMESKPAFDHGPRFADLWTANADALRSVFPPDKQDAPFDASRADAALAQHLAFWTGKNCERIQKIMLQSGLVRDKWIKRPAYLQTTIIKAVAMQKNIHRASTVVLPPTVLQPKIQRVTGFQYMTADKQMEFFDGCCYIQDLHRVFVPSGEMLKPEQFNATYGGYVFQLDEDGKKTTKKAWEAFTESQVLRHPKANGSIFKPSVATGTIIQREGRALVNTYVDIKCERLPGDPTPFLTHLQKLLPNEHDRAVMLSYMAACVQHKGIKFQWAPFIQGVEGNGKTLLTRCVMNALGRRYTHFPKSSDLDNKFNGWLLNKLFIGIEDIYVPDNRGEILETLKPMITGSDGLEIQFKGADQITADICCNFIINSNHKDALRSKEDHRRFAVFFTQQQTKSDLARDGMSGDYFPSLYRWLDSGGYAIVTEYLYTYPIPDKLNPAVSCHRAPETSSTLEAVGTGLGRIEQEIIEAIEEGRPGFAGGWISSVALDKMLNNNRSARMIPLNKRRELLNSIGYDWHPGLINGRVNNPIMIDDNKKPRLFIKAGHPDKNVKEVVEIVRLYSQAQFPG